MDGGAAYTLDRTAALAGVPRSTVHYWAKKETLVPSVSSERVRLWSYSDLIALRIIDWLRRTKESPTGHQIPRSSMPTIRKALAELRRLQIDLWSEERGPSVVVHRDGKIIVKRNDGVGTVVGKFGAVQDVRTDLLDVIAPFDLWKRGTIGPDLHAPRPHLRIVPGKLAGAPHVAETRVATEALAALAARHMPVETIASLYPSIERAAIDEAIELEAQLQRNLAAA